VKPASDPVLRRNWRAPVQRSEPAASEWVTHLRGLMRMEGHEALYMTNSVFNHPATENDAVKRLWQMAVTQAAKTFPNCASDDRG